MAHRCVTTDGCHGAVAVCGRCTTPSEGPLRGTVLNAALHGIAAFNSVATSPPAPRARCCVPSVTALACNGAVCGAPRAAVPCHTPQRWAHGAACQRATRCSTGGGRGLVGRQFGVGNSGVSIWPPHFPRQTPGLPAWSPHPLVLRMPHVSFLVPCFRQTCHRIPQPK